jgi:hypothetical protein
MPEHITSLATSAVLVSVEISQWTGSVSDEKVRDEVVAAKGAKRTALSTSKHVMADCDEHKMLKAFRTSISNGLTRFCYPWAGSLWVLPMARHKEFMAWYEDRVKKHDELLADLKRVYPEYVRNQAFQSTGLMFNINDYPTVEELDERYTINLVQLPVPMNDWRVTVSQDLADDLHIHYTREATRMARQIAEEQSKEFVTIVKRLHDGVGYTQKTEDDGTVTVKRNKVVESTFQKCIDLIKTYEQFNPTNSAELEAARAGLSEALHGYSLTDLRESDSARAKVSADVGAVLAKFGKRV